MPVRSSSKQEGSKAPPPPLPLPPPRRWSLRTLCLQWASASSTVAGAAVSSFDPLNPVEEIDWEQICLQCCEVELTSTAARSDGVPSRVTIAQYSTNVPAGEEPLIAVRLPDGTVRDTIAARLSRGSHAGAAADDAAVAHLTAMGFAEAQARAALGTAAGDLERAALILLDPAAAAAAAGAAAGSPAGAAGAATSSSPPPAAAAAATATVPAVVGALPASPATVTPHSSSSEGVPGESTWWQHTISHT
jgi:hypothetical protein